MIRFYFKKGRWHVTAVPKGKPINATVWSRGALDNALIMGRDYGHSVTTCAMALDSIAAAVASRHRKNI